MKKKSKEKQFKYKRLQSLHLTEVYRMTNPDRYRDK